MCFPKTTQPIRLKQGHFLEKRVKDGGHKAQLGGPFGSAEKGTFLFRAGKVQRTATNNTAQSGGVRMNQFNTS